jgi:uncharacterized protein (TIGR03437 family)
MGSTATVRRLFATVLLGVSSAWGQSTLDWYHVGNSLVNLSLADLSTGPVSRVWYSADGGTLYATTALGRTFETKDFETWQASAGVPGSPPDAPAGVRPPEPGAQIRGQYAFGSFVYRSQNLGASWDNLTAWRSRSLIGKPLDLAVSPRDQEEITVASSGGVYRSTDAGKSWSGLNRGLPNFPGSGARLRSLPSGVRGVQLELDGGKVFEWQPGGREAWVPAISPEALNELKSREDLQTQLGVRVTAFHQEGNTVYAGLSDGRIVVSIDGALQQPYTLGNEDGPVESFWVNPQDPQTALAVLGPGRLNPVSRILPRHVLRTVTGGNSWDDLSGGLPDVAAHGITALSGALSGASSGAMYVATEQGVFYTLNGPRAPNGIVYWNRLGGLPQAAATDVRLDSAGTQLGASVEGFGVYVAAAPHRLDDPQVISAADLTARPAAPGAVMIVAGMRVTSARASDLPVSVLSASEAESQIQIPFEARGDQLPLSVEAPSGGRRFDLPLASVSPAILVGPDGSPVLYDADTSATLDAANPARSRTRIQIMAAGLGRVKPEWPAGVDAPLDNPPAVVADVRAMLDGAPVDVTRAVLAPGYVGWYLVEIEIPKIVNSGPCELYLDVDGHPSNRVRVYIEP